MLLKRRPLTNEDVENTFDEESKLILNTLVEKKIVIIINSSGVNFYKCLSK